MFRGLETLSLMLDTAALQMDHVRNLPPQPWRGSAREPPEAPRSVREPFQDFVFSIARVEGWLCPLQHVDDELGNVRILDSAR